MKERKAIFMRQVSVPIYRCPLLLCLADSMEATRAVVKKHHLGSEFEQNTECSARVTFDSKGRFGILFERCGLTYRVIAHECFHLTVVILRYHNVTLDASDTHEAHAYLCGCLTEWVYKMLGKAGEKIQS